MICKFSLENYKAFGERADLDFFANKNIKRFDYNYLDYLGLDILKTIGIYGPNNTGKTCLLTSLIDLKVLMLNEQHSSFSSAFAKKGEITSFSIEYLINGRFYRYCLDYDNSSRQYLHESLFLLAISAVSSTKTKIFERTSSSLNWIDMEKSLKNANVMKLFSPSFPFMIVFNDDENSLLKQAKQDYLDFANSITFLKMDEKVDISNTIKLIQSNPKAAKFMKEFVKNCDLHISDFGFDNNVYSDTPIDDKLHNVLNDPSFSKENLKLYSLHNGYRVPSILFESSGTLKLIALSGYIYDALSNGKILIVDEIDSSLHHILTKSIVAMFSNMLNNKAQLIFSTQDALLLDLKEMFRKDQIYLVDISNSSSSKVSRLSSYTSRGKNGIRGDEDIVEYYLKGQFGSIPSPDLFSSLEEAIGND